MQPSAIQSSTSAGSNRSDETPTCGRASMSTAVPTLHRIATYPATGTRAITTAITAATGTIANLISPLPTSAPTSAAAASVAASQASVPAGSDAEASPRAEPRSAPVDLAQQRYLRDAV